MICKSVNLMKKIFKSWHSGVLEIRKNLQTRERYRFTLYRFPGSWNPGSYNWGLHLMVHSAYSDTLICWGFWSLCSIFSFIIVSNFDDQRGPQFWITASYTSAVCHALIHLLWGHWVQIIIHHFSLHFGSSKSYHWCQLQLFMTLVHVKLDMPKSRCLVFVSWRNLLLFPHFVARGSSSKTRNAIYCVLAFAESLFRMIMRAARLILWFRYLPVVQLPEVSVLVPANKNILTSQFGSS